MIEKKSSLPLMYRRQCEIFIMTEGNIQFGVKNLTIEITAFTLAMLQNLHLLNHRIDFYRKRLFLQN